MKQLCLLAALASLSLLTLAQDAAVAELTLKPAAPTGMSWDQTELTVKAGQKVKLTLDNTIIPNLPPLPHNWVLVKPGKDAVVGNASLQMAADPTAASKHYIPEASKADILASTKLAQPNAKEVIEFTAPEAGDYPYICTFPGHFLLMKGVLHVK